MIREFALQWPVLRQILKGKDGTGPEAMSRRTQALRPKNEGAKIARSVCPYCAVGCGQLVFIKTENWFRSKAILNRRSPVGDSALKARTALNC